MKKVIAIASGGGHWKQLILLREAFDECSVKYVTTIDGLPQESGLDNFEFVIDANRNEKLKVIYMFFQLLLVFFRFKPDVVISTGAAPGLMGIALGRCFFAKTIWIDSIANGDELSMAGKMSKKVANKVLTQWADLTQKDSVIYQGSIF